MVSQSHTIAMPLARALAQLGPESSCRDEALEVVYHAGKRIALSMGASQEHTEDALHDILFSWLKRSRPIHAEFPEQYLRAAISRRLARLTRRERARREVTLTAPHGEERSQNMLDTIGNEGVSGAWFIDVQRGFPLLEALFQACSSPEDYQEALRAWFSDTLTAKITRADKRQNTRDAIAMLFDIHTTHLTQRALLRARNPDMDHTSREFERRLARLQKRLSRARCYVLEILRDEGHVRSLGLGELDLDFFITLFEEELRERCAPKSA